MRIVWLNRFQVSSSHMYRYRYHGFHEARCFTSPPVLPLIQALYATRVLPSRKTEPSVVAQTRNYVPSSTVAVLPRIKGYPPSRTLSLQLELAIFLSPPRLLTRSV